MPHPAPCLLIVRQRLFALFGALVLATACLQAVGPIAAPLERTHGSAFSAATVDVAVIRARPAEAARVAPLPLPNITAPLPVPVAVPLQLRSPPIALRPDSTGPPLPDLPELRPGPRAPPHA